MARVGALVSSALCALALLAPPTTARAEKLTVTQYGRILATLPWAVALEKGMFKDAGLDVDGITAGSGGGTSVRNMLAGSLPFAELASSAVIAAVKAGVDLEVVDTACDHPGELAWAAKAGNGINSIKDLVGKRVAFTNPRSTTESVIRYALQKEGLTDKVQVLAMGGLGPGITALMQGAVAAAPLNDPQMTLEAQRFHILFHAYDYFPHFSWAVDVTTRAFAKSHPDQVRALVAVHRKAVDYVYAHPKEAAAIYAKVWEVPQKEADAILPKYFVWKQWSTGEFDPQGLAAVLDGLRIVGDLNGPFDWSTVIDQSFLPADLQRPL